MLLCRRHHRAVHEGGVTVCIDKKEQVVFFTPKGRAISDAPHRIADPNYRGNFAPLPLRPSGYDGSARWKRDSDVPWATEARVIDALDHGA